MRIPLKESKTVTLPDYVKEIKNFVIALNNNEFDELVVTKDSKIPFLITMKYAKLNLLIENAVREQIREIDSVVARSVRKVNMESLTKAQSNLLKIRNKLECFDNMSEEDVMQVTSDVEFLQFGANEIVFDQNQSGEHIYYIVKGNVKIFAYNQIERANFKHLTTLQEGSVLGEMSPITGEKRSARALTGADSTILLAFSFRREMEEENKKAMFQLYKNFVKIISRKLIDTNNKLTAK
ncbi:MAG: hypothetical protein KU37_04795 [Sulfuricurvum sp. PC08-66]|nr:MAG: hypothetical protein KU37_04795 [Sulfuricurvum sp. PC08-66]